MFYCKGVRIWGSPVCVSRMETLGKRYYSDAFGCCTCLIQPAAPFFPFDSLLASPPLRARARAHTHIKHIKQINTHTHTLYSHSERGKSIVWNTCGAMEKATRRVEGGGAEPKNRGECLRRFGSLSCYFWCGVLPCRENTQRAANRMGENTGGVSA